MNGMNKRTLIAIVLVLTLPLAMVLFLLLHQPQKPVPHRQVPRVTELVGVGIAIRIGPGRDAVIIQQVLPNTPASEAHITSGLIVSKVDGVSLEGKPLADCVGLIRGPVGTTVRLDLVTPDNSQTNTVELTRQKFKL